MIEPSSKSVVLVDGCRLPFMRSGTEYFDQISYDLAREVLKGVLVRNALEPDQVDAIIMGTVVQNPATSNVARDAALGAGFPNTVPAYTVTMACISANRAIADAVAMLKTGQAEVVIAGGVEVLSDVPSVSKKRCGKSFSRRASTKTPLEYRKFVQGLAAADMLPQAPAIAEFTTEETMGTSADKLAAAFGVSRQEQDEYALRSHQLAAQATHEGKLEPEIVSTTVPPLSKR